MLLITFMKWIPAILLNSLGASEVPGPVDFNVEENECELTVMKAQAVSESESTVVTPDIRSRQACANRRAFVKSNMIRRSDQS